MHDTWWTQVSEGKVFQRSINGQKKAEAIFQKLKNIFSYFSKIVKSVVEILRLTAKIRMNRESEGLVFKKSIYCL